MASASRTSRVFLKFPKGLYNSAMLEEQVFYFFYKMPRELRALVLMTQAACIISQKCTRLSRGACFMKI